MGEKEEQGKDKEKHDLFHDLEASLRLVKTSSRRKFIHRFSTLGVIACICYALLSSSFGVLEHTHTTLKSSSSSECPESMLSRERFVCQIKTTRRAFEDWVASQSKTQEEASREYTRRYRRATPGWFETWYKFALHNNVTIFDDFDQLELDLKPLRSVDPKVLKERMMEVSGYHMAEEGKKHLSLLSIHRGQADIRLPWGSGILKAFKMILDPITHLAPDVNILVSWGDEPLIRASENNAWTYQLERWSPHARNSAEFSSKACTDSHVLNFKDRKMKRLQYKERHDVCIAQDKDYLRDHHGKYQNFVREYNLTFPILSTAKMSTNEDILFPMRGYQYAVDYTHDPIPWDRKSNSLYWRGSTSGQINTMSNWNKSHRSRWVLNAQFWNQSSSALHRSKGSDTERVQSIIMANGQASGKIVSQPIVEALQRLPEGAFNVSFTGFIFCNNDPLACKTLETASPKGDRMPGHAAHEHKFLFDLDGLGMSERYYSLLMGNSVVLKQTEWAEWHDEYLIPWIHFVPVSLSMKELPELLDFLLNDEYGQQVSRAIAEESTQWVKTKLSLKFQSAYLLRTLFEYADIIRT